MNEINAFYEGYFNHANNGINAPNQHDISTIKRFKSRE
jgi:hypothetical protein